MKRVFFLLAAVAFAAACSSDDDAVASVPEQIPASITCHGVTVDFAQSPEWTLSRSNGWVAFSNYDRKTQYLISWDGGMASGTKDNPRLGIATDGECPVHYNLERLEINVDGVNCTVDFAETDGKTGRAVFPL